MKKNDWELINPNLQDEIKQLNENITNLRNENEELKNNITSLKEELVNVRKLNIEHSSMFNDIKIFLEENREKYMHCFETIFEKIKNNEKKINEKFVLIDKNNEDRVHDIKVDIDKQNDDFNKKIFDPTYRLRLNNLRWRNTGVLSLLNPCL